MAEEELLKPLLPKDAADKARKSLAKSIVEVAKGSNLSYEQAKLLLKAVRKFSTERPEEEYGNPPFPSTCYPVSCEFDSLCSEEDYSLRGQTAIASFPHGGDQHFVNIVSKGFIVENGEPRPIGDKVFVIDWTARQYRDWRDKSYPYIYEADDDLKERMSIIFIS